MSICFVTTAWVLNDMGIDLGFNGSKLLGRHSAEMGKVEPQPVRRYQGTGLLDTGLLTPCEALNEGYGWLNGWLP